MAKFKTHKEYMIEDIEETMRNISEDQWFAGWLFDLEYILWLAVTEGVDADRFNEDGALDHLRMLSDITQHWCIHEGPVSLEWWIEHVKTDKAQKIISGIRNEWAKSKKRGAGSEDQ